jgi:dihydroxyacetone kinase-like protein
MIARAVLGGGRGLLWSQVPVYFVATFAAGLLAAAAYAFLGDVSPVGAQHHPKRDPQPASQLPPQPVLKPKPQPRSDPKTAAAPDWSRRQGITMVDAAAMQAWIRAAAHLMEDNAQYLTHLDAVIGDADHGTNMRRGFQAAVVMVDAPAPVTPGAVLDIAGQAFMSSLGGAAGPLYGTGFRKAAEALGSDANVTPAQFGVALRAALTGIQELGAAVVGDKTMVDAWDPAVIAYQAVINSGGDMVEATGAAAKAAERGLHATAAMQARKGRASYVGARTIGQEDPGAASSVLILRALATTTAFAAGLLPVAAVAAVAAAPPRRRA